MKKTIITLGLAWVLCVSGVLSGLSAEVPSGEEVRGDIKLFFESRFEEMKPAYRGHWALRLYRITGDTRYLEEIRSYGERFRQSFQAYVQGIDDPAFREEALASRMDSADAEASEKKIRRQAVLREVPEYLLMHKLLYFSFQLKSLGLHQKEESFEQALQWLREFPFRRYLLDERLMRLHAAEVANDVYYLKALGLDSPELEFRSAFEAAHQETDAGTDAVVFENKIYGLTHLIIAASGYYQKYISKEEFGWILDYFADNLDRILERTKPDVVAEVGLCFRLAGLSDHPVVHKTSEYIRRAWDPASGLIPSQKGGSDLNKSEHRNVIAYMLLSGFDRLYPGPDLSRQEKTLEVRI